MVKKLDTLDTILNRATPIDSSLQAQQPQSVVKPAPVEKTPQVATTAQTQATAQPLTTTSIQASPTPTAAPQQGTKQSDYTFYSSTNSPDGAVTADDIRRYTGYNIDKTPEEQAAEKRRRMNYDEMYKVMDDEIKRSAPETDAQIKAREKREKRQRLWASIGDGVSALANLYFTGKGAPNMYDKNGGMLKKHNEMLERMKQEREADKERHLNYVMRRAQLENNELDRNLEEQRQRQNAILAARRAKQQEDEHGWQRELMSAKIDAMQADAENKGTIAAAQAGIQKAKKELLNAQTDAQRTVAKRNLATAQKALSDAQSNRIKANKVKNSNEKEFVAYDKKGNKHSFSSASAQERFARSEGTWVNDYTNETSTKHDAYTGKPVVTTKKVAKGGHSRNPKQWASGLKF